MEIRKYPNDYNSIQTFLPQEIDIYIARASNNWNNKTHENNIYSAPVEIRPQNTTAKDKCQMCVFFVNI